MMKLHIYDFMINIMMPWLLHHQIRVSPKLVDGFQSPIEMVAIRHHPPCSTHGFGSRSARVFGEPCGLS